MSRHAPVLPQRIALRVWDRDPTNYKIVAIDTSKSLRSKETADKILSSFLVDWHEYEIVRMKVCKEINFFKDSRGKEDIFTIAPEKMSDLDMDFSPGDAILWRHQTKSMMITQFDTMNMYANDSYGMMFEREYGVKVEYVKRESFLHAM